MSRILISGASGLIGSALVSALEGRGNKVMRLVRRLPEKAHEIQWDPLREIPPETVSGFDVVVHLSGESVAGRWTAAKKQQIRDSRIVNTQNLTRTLTRAENPPQTFLCASAVGYYGNRGEEILIEQGPAGAGFLPEVCREWEAATAPASSARIRVVNLRFGIVLSPRGGALKQMLLPFRLGLGGRIGNGRQWWSWIHIDDVVGAILHILDSEKLVGRPTSSPVDPLSGPVNLVSPNPVTNAEFTRELSSALKRPALLPIPAFAAKLAFGEFANEGLLASARVAPKKLIESGFEFRFPELGSALADLTT
ncbi:MAG TPA: TIGR01777 family oxidoreductase [Terriglobales bacterium]|nr:TIGR01777 family oxidoreductase [Terriglobales bacterium]